MTFNKDHLHRDEQVVLDFHPHWVMFVKAVAAVVVTSAVGAWLYWGLDLDGIPGAILNTLVALAIVASLLYLVQRWVSWISTNFVVTTDRCIYRSGIIVKRGVEIPLDRVNTVFFEQGIVDRLIGAGTLMIESAGENGLQTFSDIKDPVGVQQVLYQEIEDNENRKFDRARPDSGLSVADELRKLADLHAEGLLSDQEYSSQRARLLES